MIEHGVDHHYRVRTIASGGATIYAAPTRAAKRLGVLASGDAWQGEEVTGQQLYITGYGSSNRWVLDATRGYVWLGMLEEVR